MTPAAPSRPAGSPRVRPGASPGSLPSSPRLSVGGLRVSSGLSVGGLRVSPGLSVGGVCLVEMRARLARRCADDDGGNSGDAGGLRNAVDAAVGPVARAGPLVDATAARSVVDGDLVWCAQAVQRAINVLEGARSALAAESARRRLHARRGEASGAETLMNATGVGGALARRVEREAEVLGAQPQVAESLGRGVINAEQAVLVAAAEVPDEVRRDLCKQAPNQTADETRKTVRAAEAAWRRESDAQRRARQRAARSASMWIDPDNGMWHLRAKFDALTGDAINRLLMSAIERNWRSDKDLPESKRRSVQQRAADALAWLLTAAGAGSGKSAGGDAETPSAAPHTGAAATQDAASAGGVTTGKPAPHEAAATGGATEAWPVLPRDAAAVAGAPAAGLAPPGAGAITGDRSVDDGWVVPSPSQMIVLTTLDNLRGGPGDQVSAAGANGESPSPAPASQAAAGAESTDLASRPAFDLLAVPGAMAITEVSTVLGAADLRRIACDTQVIPVVMGGPSEVLDVGRAKRTITPAIRRALIARDQRCVWPGCERAPIHCDGHHIQHWIDDGPTCVDNLALLCHGHHQRLHEYNLVLHPPREPAPPGEGWTVTPASPRKPRTPSGDHVRQNC